MNTNPLLELTKLGQSIWIDYLGRGRIASGLLQRHIEEDGLRGVTSNPSIFEKAITSDRVYDAPIDGLARKGSSVADIDQAITSRDVQLAADLFRPLFDTAPIFTRRLCVRTFQANHRSFLQRLEQIERRQDAFEP